MVKKPISAPPVVKIWAQIDVFAQVGEMEAVASTAVLDVY